jgi:hypothetical protein
VASNWIYAVPATRCNYILALHFSKSQGRNYFIPVNLIVGFAPIKSFLMILPKNQTTPRNRQAGGIFSGLPVSAHRHIYLIPNI